MPKTKESLTESKTTKAASASSEPAMTSVLMRLSQQFNLLAILLIALFLFQAYTFYKLKTLETTGVSGTGTQAQQESPFSEKNLIASAKDLGLDTKKFEQCLKSDDKKSIIQADMAAASELGVQGTPGFFINGRFLGGAFPFEAFKEIIDKEIAGTATDNCTDYSEEMQQYCSDPANAGFIPAAREVAVGNSVAKGPENAKVTIIEFSDFECPFCQRAFPTVQQIMDTYPNDVRLVYKHLPLTNIHPNAERAAVASECARDQGKFWELHDKMFTPAT